MDNYRIPKPEEFVQGFEFEVGHDVGFGIFEGDSFKEIHKDRIWITRKVTWKTDKMSEIWDCPFNIESFIEQGLIRVKDGQ